MSRVNVEGIAFNDPRFARLAGLLGLADADHARGKMEHIWFACTIRGELEVPAWVVEQHLGARGPDALIESELARWGRGRGDSNTRRMYICGARGRTEWYSRNQEQSSKGGKTRAANASRVAGKFTSQVGGDETSAPAPAPAPAPAQEDPEKNSASPSGCGTQPLLDKILEHTGELGLARATRPKKPKPSDPTPAESASVRVVLDKLTAQNGVRYSGTTQHTKLIVRHLRSGITEMDLRAVIGYCALELNGGWRDDDKMRQYLRPETLFGPETISKYLDPARTWFSKLDAPKPKPALTIVEASNG